MVEARGFADESPKDMLVLLMEEIGELARAIRKNEGIKMAGDTKRSEMEDEFADCLIYLIDLANHYKIDLEKAFTEKEEKNNKRVWK
jgi:NTP pyrophosphatase (non-canonical NTP hydrolase)